ncbi:MAG: hypothetical protein ACOC8B_00510 [Gemmatimonadota bacterium]
MPLNVLLLPLLGGYVFVSYWNVTRFDARRYSGQRLFFHAAVAGTILMSVAFITARAVIVLKPELHDWWHRLVPFEYTGASMAAFALGAMGWYPLNRFFDRDEWASRAVETWGDYLEALLMRAISEPQQVSVTLSNGKVYVGFVTRNFDPAFDRKYIQLMPVLSGYRAEATKELVITNDYGKVYRRMTGSNISAVDAVDEFELVIPASEIVSANLFDPEVYRLFGEASLETSRDRVPAGG